MSRRRAALDPEANLVALPSKSSLIEQKGAALQANSVRGEFAHGKVDPHEAGKKGGKTSGNAHDK